MKSIQGKYLLVILALCGVISAAIGITNNSAGIFFTPMAEDFGVGRASTGLTLTILNIVFSIAGMICPGVMKKIRMKPYMILCTAVLAGSTFAISLCKSIWPVYILSALRGFAAGMIGFVFITMVLNNWFVSRNALVTSVVLGFSGISGAILSPVLNSAITSKGWRTAMAAAAVLTVVLCLPSILFPIDMKPEMVGEKALGADEVKSTDTGVNVSKKKILMPVLGIMMLFSVLSGICTSMSQYFPSISESFGMASGIGALMVSACMAANTCGKILLGTLIEKIGSRISMILFSGLVILGAFCVMTMHSTVFMLAGAALMGLVYSLATVGVVVKTKEMFGVDSYASVYPKAAMANTLAAAAGPSLYGAVFDMTQSYIPSLIMVMVFMAGELAIVILTAGKSGVEEG